MKSLYYYTVFIFISSIFITSCTPAYIPNRVNTPLLSNSGELQASFSTGISGFDPQISYALTDKIGIMANGSFANRKNDTTDNYHVHNFLELGSGYYGKFDNIGRYGFFGGFGIGNVKTDFSNDITSKKIDATLNRFFAQPSIGAVTNYFDGSFALRMIFVNTRLNNNISDNPDGNDFFFEPVVTTRFGYKYVKLLLQAGLSFRVLNAGYRYEHQPFILNFGIHFTLFQEDL